MTAQYLPGAPRLQDNQAHMLARIWGTGRHIAVVPGQNATLDALVRRGCLVRADGVMHRVSDAGVIALRNYFEFLAGEIIAGRERAA